MPSLHKSVYAAIAGGVEVLLESDTASSYSVATDLASAL